MYSQTPSDALTMKKNELCIAIIYQHDTWDMYWEGTKFRENQNIGTLTRKTILPMVAYGLTDKLNLIVSLPYVSTDASGGQMRGVSGLQDFSIFAKYKIYDSSEESSGLSAFVTGGFGLPASSYLSDYMPFSLGLGTQEYSIRGIVKYEHNTGIYIRGSYAYLYRTTTEAERDYYYADGSYYTTTMDVPNATTGEIALGGWLLNRSLQLEATAGNQTSLSGDDIRTQNAGQPTNKMDMTIAGFKIRYFTPVLSGLSILGGYSKILDGRNVGDSEIISAGLTYQFHVKKSSI